MKKIAGKATDLARDFILEIVLVGLCIFLSIKAENFLTVGNFLNILGDIALQGMIAFGMTMVIIAGEIDLSVGSAVSFSGCLALWVLNRLSSGPDWHHAGWAFCVAAVAAVGASALAGVFSGMMRVRFRVPTFISTLAWMTVLEGLAGIISNGFTLSKFPHWFTFLGLGRLFSTSTFPGIPVQAIVFLAVFFLLQFVMNYTTFGRSIYAVGGNAEAARLSGINVGFVKITVMAIVGALAGLAGIIQASHVYGADHKIGQGWELEIIAAVIVGGTSLMGGAGRIWGTFIGVVFLGVVENGMTMIINDDYIKMTVRGTLIFAAVLLNVAMPSKRR